MIKKNSIIYVFIFFILVSIATFRTPGIDRDSLTYIDLINRPISELWFQEPSFTFIVSINRFLFNNSYTIFFFVYAFLGIGLKLIAISKVNRYQWVALFTYIVLYFALHDLTQIRAGAAGGFFLLALFFRDKSKTKALICSIFSILFHYGAILGFAIYFFSCKRISKTFYSGVVLFSMMLSTVLSQNFIVAIASYLPNPISYKLNSYIAALNNSGLWSDINQFNIYYIMLIIMFFINLFLFERAKENVNGAVGYNEVIVLKVIALAIVSYYILVPVPILAGRFSEFYGIAIVCFLPQFLSLFKKNKYFILVVSFVLIFLLYRGIRLNYEIILEALFQRL
ncbi:MAG: EpsG family protein [Vibrio sp.]